jgi:di/tricarboxylate transporter
MNAAWVSLAALGVAILVGTVWRFNVGVLAFALAYVVGTTVGGMKVSAVTAGFPTPLFVVLVAVGLLFGVAQVNGTLDALARHGVKLARGNVGLVPVAFFLLTLGLSTLGAGNIAAAALMAPLAMAAAARLRISAFLMIIMVANAANAGAYSPIAPTGLVANELMAQAGLPGVAWQMYWNTFLAQTVVAFAGYAAFGGWRLLRSGSAAVEDTAPVVPFGRAQWLTIVVLGAVLVAVAFFDVDVVAAAFVGVAVLALGRAGELDDAVRRVPWNTILMVGGVSTLISVLQHTGGIDVIVDLLVRVSTPQTVTGSMAFVAGIVSAYSSTMGVVLPTFLPTVPELAARLGADPLAIASSINVGGHLVDVSPLSTVGALCLAAAHAGENQRQLFNRVLAWGLSMAVVGALVCWLFFGVL